MFDFGGIAGEFGFGKLGRVDVGAVGRSRRVENDWGDYEVGHYGSRDRRESVFEI